MNKTFFIGLCLAVQAVANPFFPGETSAYEVSYFGIPMGEAHILVGAAMQQEAHLVWPIILIGRTKPFQPYPINDKLVIYWNPETKKSMGVDAFFEENKKRRREKIRFHYPTHSASVVSQKEGEPAQSATYAIGQETMDITAAAFFLRHQPLQEGQTFELPVFTGKKSLSLQASILGKRRVKTRLGETEAFLVLVRSNFGGNLAAKRDIRLFLSADEQRIPLLIEAELVLGTLVAELVRHEPGKMPPPTGP